MSSRPPQITAASRHGSQQPPNHRAAARASAPTSSTTAPTGPPGATSAGAGGTNSVPNSAATPTSTASTRSATAPIRRNQPRTVDAGHSTKSATRRCPHPEALANNPAPITVTASARRSSTLAGSNT